MDKSYKRKNYYKPTNGRSNNWNSNKKFKNYLTPGMKGFFCTCNARERDCVRESYNILNEYADKIDEEQHLVSQTNSTEEKEEVAEAAGDIEDDLKKEIANLKTEHKFTARFNSVDTGLRNSVFIKTTLEDPVTLAVTILNDIAATKTQKARFLMRLVPVEVTCKANLEDMKTAAGPLFDKHFKCEPTTFAIVINKRYNDSVLRDEVISSIALLVTDRNRDHKADLKEAKQTVLIEIMKGLCCMAVLPDYKKLRHYNLAELAKPDQPPGEPATKSTDEDCETAQTMEDGQSQDEDEEPQDTEESQVTENHAQEKSEEKTCT